MDILNFLRRIIFGVPRLVEEEVCEETTRVKRYNSILTEHMFQHLIGPSFELVSAMVAAEGKDGDCDFCLMFDVDECVLHRTTGLCRFELELRDLAADVNRKSDVNVHHRGLVFRAGLSTRSNRCVLFIKGDSEIVDNI